MVRLIVVIVNEINEFVMILSDFFSNFYKIRHSERFNEKKLKN
jgi:hypothetical protein